jgi:ubiquinone/menaquinone biosynthesis C-methylase UbiE
MKAHPNYGVDSPRIVATLFALGIALFCLGLVSTSAWRWISIGLGMYFLLGASGMLFYSKIGKLRMRDRLLNRIPWRGDERILDVGCGRGLLTVAAAHRVPRGSVVGVDVWNAAALSGNRADSVLQNARSEGVANRVEVKQGDARQLPFAEASFDAVVSNFVVHELKSRQDREQMMREVARVLKPDGHVALIDFIFTDDCVRDLTSLGVDVKRLREGFLSFWISAILNFGVVKTYHVFGKKR